MAEHQPRTPDESSIRERTKQVCKPHRRSSLEWEVRDDGTEIAPSARGTDPPDGAVSLSVVIVTDSYCIPGMRPFDAEARRVVEQAIAEERLPAKLRELPAGSAMFGGAPMPEVIRPAHQLMSHERFERAEADVTAGTNRNEENLFAGLVAQAGRPYDEHRDASRAGPAAGRHRRLPRSVRLPTPGRPTRILEEGMRRPRERPSGPLAMTRPPKAAWLLDRLAPGQAKRLGTSKQGKG